MIYTSELSHAPSTIGDTRFCEKCKQEKIIYQARFPRPFSSHSFQQNNHSFSNPQSSLSTTILNSFISLPKNFHQDASHSRHRSFIGCYTIVCSHIIFKPNYILLTRITVLQLPQTHNKQSETFTPVSFAWIIEAQ